MQSRSKFFDDDPMTNKSDDIISNNIDYFKNLFTFIDNIHYFEFNIQSFKNSFENLRKFKDQEKVKEDSIYYLLQALSESIFKESSQIFRYTLSQLYNFKFEKFYDHQFQTSCFDNIFLNKPPVFNEDNAISKSLSDIFKNSESNLTKTEKEIGKFFKDYITKNSSYKPNIDDVEKYMKEEISKKNTLNKLDMLLLLLPEYFKLYREINEAVFAQTNENYISIQERYYLAIMASALIGCDFLTKDLIRYFVINGGNHSWLSEGLNAAPTYIIKLAKINNIIAFRPWTLTIEDLKELKIENKINSFIQSIILLTTFQRMASIYSSLNIHILTEESEVEEIKINEEAKSNQKIIVDKIYEQLENIENADNNSKGIAEVQSTHGNSISNLAKESQEKIEKSKFNKFVDLPSYQSYSDFKPDCKSPYLYSSQISFDSDVYYNLEGAWPEVAQLIKKDFQYLQYELTSNKIGSFNETQGLEFYRRAIVTYVEKLYGVLDESFDGSQTNKLLSKELKTFIKSITCYSTCINIKHLISYEGFNEEDLMHILFLSTMTKQICQLTYVIKVLNDLRITEE